jgi:hypothetical protein
MARFPGARTVTTPGIVDYINSNIDSDAQLFSSYFGDTISKANSRPSPLDRDIIDLEGDELRVIEVGRGDIAPSAVLHIQALDAVVAGDVAYNQIHPMLALGGPADWTSGSRALVSSSISIHELWLPVTRNPKPPITMWRRFSTAPVPISRIS